MRKDKNELRNAFLGVQKRLERDLFDAKECVEHRPSKGAMFEAGWQKVLTDYLPKRYAVAGGGVQVVDCKGGLSHQLDVVLYDSQYTPLLYRHLGFKYIPAEAVYAVFESKSVLSVDDWKYAVKKIASVRKLHRTSIEIHHAGGVFPPKKLFNIIGGVLALDSKLSGGFTNQKVMNSLLLEKENEGRIDCGCALASDSFHYINGKMDVKTGEANLIHFLFTLLSRLQKLATVPAIDWSAYAKLVDDIDSKESN